MNNKFSYDEQEKNLTARNKAFLDYLTRRGITPDFKIPSEIEQKRKQEIAKKAYHNTQVLLENYRDMVWTLESTPDQIASELEMPFATLDELLARIDIEGAMDNKKIESRLITVTKSRILIDRLNEAISFLRKKPKTGEDLYRIIYKTYVDPETCDSVFDLFYELNMSRRKYYDLRQQAIKLISMRLWSVPDREIELWLEILNMIEHQSD